MGVQRITFNTIDKETIQQSDRNLLPIKRILISLIKRSIK